jgi:bla regulator protein BlaR1
MFISLIIPALNIQMNAACFSVENNFSYVNHAFMDFSETVEFVKASATEKVASVSMIPYLLILGMLIALVRVGYQLFSIYKNINKYEVKNRGKYHYVLIDQHQSTHSFFNYIFVHKSEFQKKRMKDVLLHEQIHADQGHSVDLLFIGFLSILQWFNPFIYLFKRALVETHEFQADQAVIVRVLIRINTNVYCWSMPDRL